MDNRVEGEEKDYEKIVENILILIENAKKVRKLTEIEQIALHILKD